MGVGGRGSSRGSSRHSSRDDLHIPITPHSHHTHSHQSYNNHTGTQEHKDTNKNTNTFFTLLRPLPFFIRPIFEKECTTIPRRGRALMKARDFHRSRFLSLWGKTGPEGGLSFRGGQDGVIFRGAGRPRGRLARETFLLSVRVGWAIGKLEVVEEEMDEALGRREGDGRQTTKGRARPSPVVTHPLPSLLLVINILLCGGTSDDV